VCPDMCRVVRRQLVNPDVVQGHLGHLTPTMAMKYTQTLQCIAATEFLRYRKITAGAATGSCPMAVPFTTPTRVHEGQCLFDM
jgi:hypothetical protein